MTFTFVAQPPENLTLMRLFSILNKGLQAMIEEATLPQSFKIGQQFEEYVRTNLFTSNYYDLLERTHNDHFNTNGYAQSSLKPDFRFRDKWTKKEFYLEAKFRSHSYHDKIIWCNDKQLEKYQEYNKIRPVFLILGRGEHPAAPQSLSLISLSAIKHPDLFPSFADRFGIEADKPIPSKVLWNR